MALLNRISSGLVFLDEFATDRLNPVWQVSPSDESRYSLTERPGYLRLKHGDPDLFILMNSPRFDHVFEMDVDYSPVRASDQGGIAAFRDKDTRIEMLEYYDPDKGTAQQWGVIRMKRTGDLFEGYGSNDTGKTWELVGVSYLTAPKIGMTLKGIQESSSDTLDVSVARVYRDTTVQVGNISAGMTVQLLSKTGTKLAEAKCEQDKDYVKVDVSKLRFPLEAQIKLFNASMFEIAATAVMTDVWGGDVYWYGMKLDLEVDTILMRQDREYQLGNMQGGLIEKKVFVVNNNDITLTNVRVSVAAFSEYFGWEWVDIAEDVYLQPGIYQDGLLLGTIQPQEKVPIWFRIKRQPEQQIASLNDYKFRIVFESG